MKTQRRWLKLIAAALLLTAVILLPRIIEAGRSSNGLGAEKNVTVAPVVISGSSQDQKSTVTVGTSVHNDTSPPLRDMKQEKVGKKVEREANENPKVPATLKHKDSPDTAVQEFSLLLSMFAPNMPSPLLNFDGVAYPGVACNCAPPDTNGEVGATQYVQIVNEGYQVFNKTTGASVLGPSGITTLWSVGSFRNHYTLERLWRRLPKQWSWRPCRAVRPNRQPLGHYPVRRRQCPDRRMHCGVDYQRCHGQL